jgi:hypothetical protein
MNGKTFLITLVGILMAIFALCNMDFQPSIIEGWNGMDGSRSVTLRKTLMNPKTGQVISAGHDTVLDSLSCGARVGAGTDVDQQRVESYGPSPYVLPNMKPQNTNDGYTHKQVPPSRKTNPLMGSGEFFQAPPSFQANLAPRFDNNGYGAYINYNRPDQQYLGSPIDPLDADRSVPMRENYDGSQKSNPPSCGKGGCGFVNNEMGDNQAVPPGYVNGNKGEIYDSLPGQVVSKSCGSDSSSAVSTGSITLTDDSGHPVQYLTQDRYMFTTKKSRLWGLGDMIRGDIPVTPNFYGNFDTYPVIASDFNRGALAVIAGRRALDPDAVRLISQVTGGDSTFGGVPLMANQVDASLSSNCTDINLTAFP